MPELFFPDLNSSDVMQHLFRPKIMLFVLLRGAVHHPLLFHKIQNSLFDVIVGTPLRPPSRPGGHLCMTFMMLKPRLPPLLPLPFLLSNLKLTILSFFYHPPFCLFSRSSPAFGPAGTACRRPFSRRFSHDYRSPSRAWWRRVALKTCFH